MNLVRSSRAHYSIESELKMNQINVNQTWSSRDQSLIESQLIIDQVLHESSLKL